jgi:hypothetical protein
MADYRFCHSAVEYEGLCLISSAPCRPPPLKGVVNRRAGGLQPSSTPSDPLSRPPLSKQCCGFAVQLFDRQGRMAWGIQRGSNVVSGVACLQGGRPVAVFSPFGYPTPYVIPFGTEHERKSYLLSPHLTFPSHSGAEHEREQRQVNIKPQFLPTRRVPLARRRQPHMNQAGDHHTARPGGPPGPANSMRGGHPSPPNSARGGCP